MRQYPRNTKEIIMKMYTNNIRIARHYLSNDMVDTYENHMDGLLRSAKSDKAFNYLTVVKNKDLVDYFIMKFDELLPAEV